MFPKFALTVTLFAAFALTACDSTGIEDAESFVGELTVLPDQSMSLVTGGAAGASQAVTSGPATLNFTSYQLEAPEGEDRDEDTLSSEMELVQGGSRFMFKMARPRRTLFEVDFFLSAADSGQPHPMKVVTSPNALIDVSQSTSQSNCSKTCSNSDGTTYSCSGNRVTTTTYKTYTRQISAAWGTPDSTQESFTPVANFAGEYTFVTTDTERSNCL